LLVALSQTEDPAIRETAEETGLILPADHGALSVAARAITPTNSPVRFHARFFLADADRAVGEAAETPELSDLAWRPLDEALKLPLYDITEAVLRMLQQSAPPFLMTYRAGRTLVT
ncbi:MAG TPA: NUDIX hydrolase, partial [Caulobacter sp.]|nr:NUDIX hydrolase [Caulobacter sp.]